MADEIEFPKWIEEAFKRWVKSCETPVDSKQRWRELAQKSVDVLSNVDREKSAR